MAFEPSFSAVLAVMAVPPIVQEEVRVMLAWPLALVVAWGALIDPSVLLQLITLLGTATP
jgi:hypothetical protein